VPSGCARAALLAPRLRPRPIGPGRIAAAMEGGSGRQSGVKPRTRRVVMARKVSAQEWEKHREQMEALGLDPTDPVPPDAMLNNATQPQQMPSPADYTMAPRGDEGDMSGGDTMGSTMISRKEQSGRLPKPLAETKQVSLQKRTLCEQVAAGRHERALSKWAEQQAVWEEHARKAQERTGRPKEHSVVHRAEEHRERLEVMELLDRATPTEVKSGGHSWYHSLRGDDGTRYVQIGNMFSGLHLPIKLHKENYVHEHVRKPILTELCKSRVDEYGQRVGPRTWRDDEYLIRRLRMYQKKMDELAPGKIPHEELLEPTIVKLGHSEDDDQMLSFGEFEEMQGDGAEDLAASGKMTSIMELPEAPPEQAPPLKRGPHMECLPNKLEFTTGVRKVCTQRITLKNVGTAVIAYEWVMSSPPHGFQESLLPGDPTSRFVCHCTKGQILPGHEETTVFAFNSPIPGTFISSWNLKTYPELISPIVDVVMHGASVEKDLLLEKRQIFNGGMFKEQVLHQVQEIIDDVVDAVQLRHPPLPDISLVAFQERYFEEQNVELGLYYSQCTWETFMDLGQHIMALKHGAGGSLESGNDTTNVQSGPPKGYRGRGRVPVKKIGPPPMKQATPAELGVPDAKLFRKTLASITGAENAREKQELSVDLERAIRAAQRSPLERSPIYWFAYETILDIAMQVPRKSKSVRKTRSLEPWPCLSPLESEAGTEQHQEAMEKRQAVRGDAAVEAELWDAEKEGNGRLEEVVSKLITGPRIQSFSSVASEALASTRLHKVTQRSLRDRIQPYVDRVGMDAVEMSGKVVFYEVDLGFLSAQVASASKDGAPIQLDITGGIDEIARSRFQGLASLLESSPLAVAIVGHLGEPEPDTEGAPQLQRSGSKESASAPPAAEGEEGEAPVDPVVAAVQARMRTLPSLEPLLDIVRDVTEGVSTSLEFVPHDMWLGDSKSFGEKVRNDASDMKVFLLENMAVFPEEKGVHRILRQPRQEHAEAANPESGSKPPVVAAMPLAWAAREAWAARSFREMQPEAFVQDSITAACQRLTSNTGIWLGAPQRYTGPFVQTELDSFVEALGLPFRGGGSGAAEATVDGGPSHQSGDEEESRPASLLIVLGGGGFSGAGGEEVLLLKLELLFALALLAQHERDGLTIALAGELATYVLTGVMGVHLGSTPGPVSAAACNALKEAIFQVLQLGVTLTLPQDLVCEEVVKADGDGGSPPAAEGAEGEKPEKPCEIYTLAKAYEAASKARIPLGYADMEECFLKVDPAVGTLALHRGEPPSVEEPPAPPADTAEGDAPADPAAEAFKAVPANWVVRDIGAGTVEQLKSALRRSRGAVWNGALGVWEEEQWQKGTRAFMAAFEARAVPDDDDEDDDAAVGDEDDEEEDEEEEGGSKKGSVEKEPEADFEVSVVIGKDSTARLGDLIGAPSSLTFVSQSGEGLLQILRGAPLPGLLACEEKGQGK